MARDRTARARIRQLLATGGPIDDPSGFATAILKERIDYKGTSVAFIQLIAAMAQEGEISREIRAKRTYGISATSETQQAFLPVASPSAPVSVRQVADEASTALTIDYDKLAKAMVRELWSVVSAVVAAQSTKIDSGSEPVLDDDYADKIATARQALDELFSDVESKAKASASKV